MSFSAHRSPAMDAADDLSDRIKSLRDDIVRYADTAGAGLPELPPERRPSAQNLLHYCALRRHDLTPLQERLAHKGLVAFDHAEAHVLASIEAVLRQLDHNQEAAATSDVDDEFNEGLARLERHTALLLGPEPAARRSRIMVTLPNEAGTDPTLLRRLLNRGMDCLRINCAYGDQDAWRATIAQLRQAEQSAGRACRIFMDLRGPKLRTGPLAPEPSILKIRPQREANGIVSRPARIWLTATPQAQPEGTEADATLVLERHWLQQVSARHCIRLRDARGSSRKWRVTDVTRNGCWAESRKTTYIENGTFLHLHNRKREQASKNTSGHGNDGASEADTMVDSLAPRESVCTVLPDDILYLSPSAEPGLPSVHERSGRLSSPGRISLPIPEVFRDARPGESVCFDDGRIAGVIEQNDGAALRIRIRHTRRPVERLAGGKGVNFSDTELELPALGEDDLRDLDFVARHADIIGLSFTNTPADVATLHQRLQELGLDDIGLVVKIETRRGYANLPGIMLEAMRFPACGVMIARGDLAAECGFQHLAELQEDILRLCEAAQLPAIWATGVLDGMTKRGHPTRAEITDAAEAQRAECVMLGKGEHVVEALAMLDGMLARLRQFQFKQQSLLRPLLLNDPSASRGKPR